MDNSGNNRYEILFMDDDGGIDPVQIKMPAKNQTPEHVITEKTFPVGNKSRAEKENKSCTLNKTNAVKKTTMGSRQTKDKDSLLVSTKDLAVGENVGPRKVAFRSHGEYLDQLNNQRRFQDFGEKHEQRQFRDRDGRGQQRNRMGKREFDRQSGSDKTGVKAIEKREGAGAHNWGSVKQEIENINKSTSDEPTLADKEESSIEQVVLHEDDETKKITFDEWKAMRGERSKPQYNIRKPNEGEDTTQWKKMVALNRKKNGESSEDEFEYDPSLYPQRVGRLQRVVNIQFNFNDARRSGGGSGRGRGRTLRPGGDYKGTRQESTIRTFGEKQKKFNPNSFKVDDEIQFPTLS